VSLENEIDKSYYAGMFSVYNRLEEGVLKAFYLLLLELTDIRNIIKLKSIGIAKELIQGLTITKLGARLAAMENSIKALKESRYKALAEGIENEPTMFESNAEKYLLEHSFRLLHLKPLSIAPIFGYLLAKEIEIRNLRLLTNSKALGMADEFVEKNLIV
jgi:V/A-type H+-transporting ATPase subunit C